MAVSIQTDAEKYTSDAVQHIFRKPPGLPDIFPRSALIVGARGAGKTMLMRYHKLQHDGMSAYFNLTAEFSGITKQVGLGPLVYETPPSLKAGIQGKAVSILALSFYAKFILKKGLPATQNVVAAVRGCLPDELRISSPGPWSVDKLEDLRRATYRAPLAAFESASLSSPLRRLLIEVAQLCQSRGTPLLVFFDKPDQALTDAAVPVLELLNQSPSYIALLAIRPGYTGRELSAFCESAPPGDHYDLHHLGQYPRSTEWFEFMRAAAESHFQDSSERPKLLAPNLDQLFETLLFASRESVRFAVKHLANGFATRGGLQEALKNDQAYLESFALSTLPRYFTRSEDFKFLIHGLQKQLTNESSVRPVNLSISREVATSFFDENENLERFIEAALRCGAFCMPEGKPWSPGLRTKVLEVAPLLAWPHSSFLPFDRAQSEPISFSRDEVDLRRSFAGAKKRVETVFFAYRMENDRSKRFKAELAAALRRHPSFHEFELSDGNTNLGNKDWPNAVRSKIRHARVVIGDITGQRLEVMFEMGFARGLRAPSISTVERRDQRASLPDWISREQLGSFEDARDIQELLSSIALLIRSPALGRSKTPIAADPDSVVWLRMKPWAEQVRAQFERELESRGRILRSFDSDELSVDVFEEAARASLLVGILDGTHPDVFVHFVCGSVVANPRAGVGDGKLTRQVLLLTEDGKANADHIAKSLRHCGNIVHIVSRDTILQKAKLALNKYREWSTSAPIKGDVK